jgi:uncharacterized membrane protein YbhN (UPF0104 family)
MSTDRFTQRALRSPAATAVKLAVSAGLLAILFSRVDASGLWLHARQASAGWLLAALGLYGLQVLASTWRWHLLLRTQGVAVRRRTLVSSFLVACFFNNFLPSNIGGDLVRIRDTARPARSRTLAATVILVDRGLGLIGLVFVAALGATVAALLRGSGAVPVWPSALWGAFFLVGAAAAPAVVSPGSVGRWLQPLARLQPERVGTRIRTLTDALDRFRARPGALASCFAGALVVHGILVGHYAAVVLALGIDVSLWDLAVVVPISLLVQMLPVSVNGFGVREATFSFYFTRLGMPMESAILLSLVAAGLAMLFSVSGAAVFLSRRVHEGGRHTTTAPGV